MENAEGGYNEMVFQTGVYFQNDIPAVGKAGRLKEGPRIKRVKRLIEELLRNDLAILHLEYAEFFQCPAGPVLKADIPLQGDMEEITRYDRFAAILAMDGFDHGAVRDAFGLNGFPAYCHYLQAPRCDVFRLLAYDICVMKPIPDLIPFALAAYFRKPGWV